MNVSKALRLFNLLMMKRSECMRNIITEFNAISNSLDKMKKKTKTMGIAGGTTGAVGGMTAVLGIALAPVTMGASLIATAVGAGMVASAGGMGAHTAKCNKKTVNKMTVVKLVYDYKSNVVDLESCLDFILSGMNDLRRHDIPRLQRAGAETDALKVAHLSQTVFREIDSEKRTSQGLSSEKLLRDFTRELDQYFTGEDDQILKKSNKSRFSGRVHLLAKNLQDHLEHLNRMWEMFSWPHRQHEKLNSLSISYIQSMVDQVNCVCVCLCVCDKEQKRDCDMRNCCNKSLHCILSNKIYIIK